MSWDQALPLLVKSVLGGLVVVGAVCIGALVASRQEARRERRRLAELCRATHDECIGPWLGRACNVCRRHPENAS